MATTTIYFYNSTPNPAAPSYLRRARKIDGTPVANPVSVNVPEYGFAATEVEDEYLDTVIRDLSVYYNRYDTEEKRHNPCSGITFGLAVKEKRTEEKELESGAETVKNTRNKIAKDLLRNVAESDDLIIKEYKK